MKILLLTPLAILAIAATACGGARDAAGGPSCGEAVLEDWGDGRVDGVYASACYLAAIDLLPEDVRAYSSAVDDLSRALQSRRTGESRADTGRSLAASRPPAGEPAGGLRDIPLPLLLLGAVAVVVAAGGGAGFALRRAGGRR